MLAGEAFDIFYRDIMECICALYGDPEFARHLIFAPERHYMDEEQSRRMYYDMHTGQWWWNIQVNFHYDLVLSMNSRAPIVETARAPKTWRYGHPRHLVV